MLVGPPASGKSTIRKALKGHVSLNRDTEGGHIVDLLPKMETLLRAGKNVVLDNTHCTALIRKPFIDAATTLGVPIHCVWMDTSIEDCQINNLFRMVDECGKIYFSSEEMKQIKNPHVFPPAVLFRYRKEFQKPSMAEGFASVRKEKFVRVLDSSFVNKALFLDYDGTLRETVPGSPHDYPTHPDQVMVLQGRAEVLKCYREQGYRLLGVSNQSGVAKGVLSFEAAEACFERTQELLGVEIETKFCSHAVPPINCYCRKPGSGLGVYFMNLYELDPKKCIFVGDQTTDRTFSERLGFQFAYPDEFFK
jgi:HAD superfamily hydrolase (TIGR01662 family)